MPNDVNLGVFRGRDLNARALITVSGTSYVVTVEQAKHGVVEFVGTVSGAFTAIFPAVDDLIWLVVNSTTGSTSFTAKTPAGAGVEIPDGGAAGVFCDGISLRAFASAGSVSIIGEAVSFDITDPQIGDALTFDGSNFVNSAGGGGGGQLVLLPAGNVTLDSDQADFGNIDLRSGGGVSAPFSVTFPDKTAGRTWIIENTTGQTCTLIGNDGSQSFLINNARCEILWDDATMVRNWLSTPTHFNLAVTNPTTFVTWDQVDADYIEFTPVAGNVVVNWPNGGSLGKRGRRTTVRNDHTSSYLDVKTNGAGTDKTVRLLPGETASFIIDDSGAIVADWTRAYERRAAITHDDGATYTVVHPDFLARWLVIGGSLTATRNLVLPAVEHHTWIIQNTTAESLVVKTAAGTGVTVPAGKTQHIGGNGTDLLPLAPPAGGVQNFWMRASDGQLTLGAASPFANVLVAQPVVLAGETFVNSDVTLNTLVDVVLPTSNGPRWGSAADQTQSWWGAPASAQRAVTGATDTERLDSVIASLQRYGLLGLSTTNLLVWYRADAITGLSDGTLIATWPDSGPNNYSATQATSGRRLTYKTAIQNGLPVARATSVDRFMLISTLSQARTSYTAYFALSYTTPQTGDAPLLVSQSAAGGVQFLADSGANVDWFASGVAFPAGVAALSGWQILAFVLDDVGNTGKIYRNGVEIYSAAYDSIAAQTDSAWLLGSYGAGLDSFVGDWGEALLYATNHSAATVAAQSALLAAKWGV